MKANTRLPGHELRNEGRSYDVGSRPVRIGSTRCSCGEVSPILQTTAARQKWHRQHKDDVRGRA